MVAPALCTTPAGATGRRAGFVALVALALSVNDFKNELFGESYLRGVLWASHWLLIGSVILLVGTAASAFGRPIWSRPVALAFTVIAACALGGCASYALWFGDIKPDWGINAFVFLLRKSLLYWGAAMAGLFLLERAAGRSAALREAEADQKRLEAQMLEARLQVMQAQVEPHFLFNTLAHLQRLYQTNPARARRMLDSFCAYLRAALPRMRGERSTLGRELDLATAYLATQQIRMGRRLRFDVDVPDGLRDAELPPMMLLSLTENAIKHGLTPLREGGHVRIEASSAADVLRVSVADTGAGLPVAPEAGGSGVGLSNTRSRLAAMHGERGRLTLARNTPRGLVATIAVPLVRASNEADARPPAAVSGDTTSIQGLA
jgi:hypothetical protein